MHVLSLPYNSKKKKKKQKKNRNTLVTTFQSTIHLLNNAIKLGSAVVNKIFLRDITVLDSFA